MSDPKTALRAYIALARGPGTIDRAAAGDLDEPLPDDVEYEPHPSDSQELPAFEDEVTGHAKDTDRPSADDDLTASQILASPMFLRVLEELSAYVAPGRARRALIESLDHAGIDPIEATSLDLREAVVDALPRLLDAMFTRDDLDLVLERLETALTHAIVPTRIPDPPASDSE